MVKIPKILLFTLLGLLSADNLPESGETFNYTHIYFQWDQIPYAKWYNLSSINVDSVDEYGEYFYTSENRTFSINPLPDYSPSTDNLFIDENIYQYENQNILDIVSLVNLILDN